MEKRFEVKVPFEDEACAKMFIEVLHALHAGYYARVSDYKFGFVAEKEISSIDEGFDIADKYSVFYRIVVPVQTEEQARHLSGIIGNLAEVLLGADDIFYNFKSCIE